MKYTIVETKKSSYRTGQLNKVKKDHVYHVKVKFYDTTGNTNCLDITNAEFEKIKEILTK